MQREHNKIYKSKQTKTMTDTTNNLRKEPKVPQKNI